MQPVDAYVLVGLVLRRRSPWTYASIADFLHLPVATVQRACKRSAEAGLFEPDRRTVHLPNAEEFFTHAVRYVAPAQLGGLVAGVPTAWAASPLRERIVESGQDPPPVWPSAVGHTRGRALRPLHAAAPEAVAGEPELYEFLALLDGLRVGDLRVRSVAEAALTAQIRRR